MIRMSPLDCTLVHKEDTGHVRSTAKVHKKSIILYSYVEMHISYITTLKIWHWLSG